MFRSLIVAGACAAVLALLHSGSKPLPAQDGVLGQMYGSGVHAYFAGDYMVAHDDLSAAIEGGSLDPRAYYFRALAAMRLGRHDEAQADLRRGAELEIGDSRDLFPIARSLERIQGRQRLMIERFRDEARMAAHERRVQERVQRYGRTGRSTARPIPNGRGAAVPAPERTDGAAPVTDTIAPAETVAPAAGGTAPADSDPFAEPPPVETPTVQPSANNTRPAAEAADDPFGTPAADAPIPDAPAPEAPATPDAEMPAEAPPTETPAEDPFAPPATETPAPEAPATTDDPFGAPEPAAEAPAGETPAADPFGAPAAEAPMPGDAAPAESPATEDPFGAAAPAGEAAMADDAAPAADPFGAATPAEGTAPAADDPFGTPATEAPATDPAPAADDPFGTAAPEASTTEAPAAEPAATDSGAAPARKGAPGALGSLFRAVTKAPFDAVRSAGSSLPIPRAAQGQAAPAAITADADPFGAPAPGDAEVNPFADDPDQGVPNNAAVNP